MKPAAGLAMIKFTGTECVTAPVPVTVTEYEPAAAVFEALNVRVDD